MEQKQFIIELYNQNPTQYVFMDINEIINLSDKLNIIYHDNKMVSFRLISDNIIYSYNNFNGFTPLDLKVPYQKIYINDQEYKRINITKNSRFSYDEELIYKVLENGKINYYSDPTLIKEKEYTLWHILTLKPIEEVTSKETLEAKLLEISYTKQLPKLLIHSCCGPCSSQVLDYLSKYFQITIFYSNSNIDSLEEFKKRITEQRKIIDCLGMNVEVIEDIYTPEDYFNAIKGYEHLQEFSRRCYQCYLFRLERTCKYALEQGFDYYTTTLSISPYKNSQWINEIGQELANKYHMKFLYSNFKLNDGYKKSIILSKKYNIYRQDYCGCVFSKNEKKNIY